MEVPRYGADYVPPVVDERDLDTIGVGLYRVKDKTKRGDYWEPSTDITHTDVEMVLLARVDDGPTILPQGVERAEIREDGKRLVMMWTDAERVKV